MTVIPPVPPIRVFSLSLAKFVGVYVWGLCILPGMAPAQELSIDRLYDPGRLTEVQIDIPEADWRSLCQQSRDIRTAFSNPIDKPFKYFRGDITIDGVKVGAVGIRKKGFLGSLDDKFPSLKINFSEYTSQDPIPGVETLTLNNNKQDGSLVSQLLTYRLFNAAGVHAPRVGYAKVTVNGEYLGVYSNVETVGRPFLKRRFGEGSGKLYEGTLSDFHPSALANLEVKLNRRAGDRGLTARLAQLLASKEPLNLEELETVVDLEPFLKFWAMESLLVFWDGYCNNQNNFWVYEQQNGKLYFMPWGADMAFSGGEGFLGFGATAVYAESMLANRLYRTEGMPERFRQTVQGLLETVWKESELIATIDGVEALVADHLHKRQSNAKREMKSVRRFISTRRDAITRQLKKGPVKVSPEPRKPVYVVQVGVGRGTFTTHWSDEAPAKLTETGTVELKVTLNGEEVVFTQLGASAHPAPKTPFDGPAGAPPRPPGAKPAAGNAESPPAEGEKPAETQPADEKPDEVKPTDAKPAEAPLPRPAIVLTGVRASDSKTCTFTLTFDREEFAQATGKTLPMRGTLMVGQEKFSIFTPFAGRQLEGEIQLTATGLKPGEPVAGAFEFTVKESHGGFAGQRGPGNGKPPARPAKPETE